MTLAMDALLVAASAAVSAALMAILTVRSATAARGARQAHAARLPWLLQAALGPAQLLLPAIKLILGKQYAARLDRQLDSLDLSPPLQGHCWMAVRVVHGLALLLPALLLPGTLPSWLLLVLAAAGYGGGGVWLRRLRVARERSIAAELPAYLDLMTVCVEAGATLTSGVRLILAQSPDTPLRSYFERVLREVRSGRPRAEAFSHVAAAFGVESLSALAAALSAAEGAGLSLGQVLRTQAAQRTAERFARAEKLAMQAPVKMLGPLILCIFPCTFIVLAVPIAVRLKEAFAS